MITKKKKRSKDYITGNTRKPIITGGAENLTYKGVPGLIGANLHANKCYSKTALLPLWR
jgi:hypothetical protein